jgi:hypothetical protein
MNLPAICGVMAGAIGLMKLGWAALKPLPEEMAGGRPGSDGRSAGAERAAEAGTARLDPSASDQSPQMRQRSPVNPD